MEQVDGQGTNLLEAALGQVLSWGMLLAIVLMALGTALGAIQGAGLPHQLPPFTSLLGSLIALEPAGILALGFLVLFATPIISIVLAVVSFIRQRDWIYALVAALVFAVLVLGIFAART